VQLLGMADPSVDSKHATPTLATRLVAFS